MGYHGCQQALPPSQHIKLKDEPSRSDFDGCLLLAAMLLVSWEEAEDIEAITTEPSRLSRLI